MVSETGKREKGTLETEQHIKHRGRPASPAREGLQLRAAQSLLLYLRDTAGPGTLARHEIGDVDPLTLRHRVKSGRNQK